MYTIIVSDRYTDGESVSYDYMPNSYDNVTNKWKEWTPDTAIIAFQGYDNSILESSAIIRVDERGSIHMAWKKGWFGNDEHGAHLEE